MITDAKNLPTLQPKIIEFHPLAVPAPTPTDMILIVYGLDDDNNCINGAAKIRNGWCRTDGC
jgi:hypothetical protein